MRIAIIGAGWVGGTVGEFWARAGHAVMLSPRHPERHRARAARSFQRGGPGFRAHLSAPALRRRLHPA